MCRSEEGAPWDGRDQIIVFQVALSFFLSTCRRGFQDLLKVGTALFTLCGYISSSMASLMSRTLYLVLAERSFCVL